LGSPWHPLLTVVYRPVGHGSGTAGSTHTSTRRPSSQSLPEPKSEQGVFWP
jgi:hypothetical protein